MRSKISKEIRKYLKIVYPNIDIKDPKLFKKLCNDLKKEYSDSKIDKNGKLIN